MLTMGGHMHEMQDVAARLVPAHQAGGAAPYYLAANKRLLHDVACGSDVPAAALALEGSALARAWTSVVSFGAT